MENKYAWCVIDGERGELIWIDGRPAIFLSKKEAKTLCERRNQKGGEGWAWIEKVSKAEFCSFIVASQVRDETLRMIRANEARAFMAV